jgi:hypothetical protein
MCEDEWIVFGSFALALTIVVHLCIRHFARELAAHEAFDAMQRMYPRFFQGPPTVSDTDAVC